MWSRLVSYIWISAILLPLLYECGVCRLFTTRQIRILTLSQKMPPILCHCFLSLPIDFIFNPWGTGGGCGGKSQGGPAEGFKSIHSKQTCWVLNPTFLISETLKWNLLSAWMNHALDLELVLPVHSLWCTPNILLEQEIFKKKCFNTRFLSFFLFYVVLGIKPRDMLWAIPSIPPPDLFLDTKLYVTWESLRKRCF